MGWASATPPGRAGIAKSPPESVAARPSSLVRCAAARGCRRPGRTAAVTAKGGLPDVSALRALAASVRLALAGAGVNPALAERVGAGSSTQTRSPPPSASPPNHTATARSARALTPERRNAGRYRPVPSRRPTERRVERRRTRRSRPRHPVHEAHLPAYRVATCRRPYQTPLTGPPSAEASRRRHSDNARPRS